MKVALLNEDGLEIKILDRQVLMLFSHIKTSKIN